MNLIDEAHEFPASWINKDYADAAPLRARVTELERQLCADTPPDSILDGEPPPSWPSAWTIRGCAGRMRG